MLRVPDGLDNEPIVAGKVEKRARLSRRAQFGEDVLGGEREEVVGGIELEIVLSQLAKHPWGIVFKLEVVLGRGRQFISDAVDNMRHRTEGMEGMRTCQRNTCVVQ